MLSFSLGAAAAIGCSCSSAPTPPESLPVLDPTYPSAAEMDYAPAKAIAHAALPRFDRLLGEFTGASRVWVKGSPALISVSIDGGVTTELQPPHYAAVLECAPGKRTVSFAEGAAKVEVSAIDPEELNAARSPVVIAAYGCFDPFDVDAAGAFVSPGDGTGTRGEKPDPYARFPAIRRLMRDVCLGDFAELGTPSVLLGAGDQVYVEPAHDRWGEFGSSHPLTSWTVEMRPRPRLALGDFVDFLDATYRAAWSFTPVDEAMRHVPTVMTWDDHEIRDGWGSQGDEHIYVDTYYAAARRAFAQHQFAHGPQDLASISPGHDASLQQIFAVHGVPVFVMDQRSARNVDVPQVLGAKQTEEFHAWIRGIDPATTDLCVIVSPIPMLFRLSDLALHAGEFGEEIWDDLRDC